MLPIKKIPNKKFKDLYLIKFLFFNFKEKKFPIWKINKVKIVK